MILEDIRYQLDQFSSFDDVRLSIKINNKTGVIYYNAGMIVGAFFDDKKNIDVFKELKDMEGQAEIGVSIGEPMPNSSDEDKINKSLDEILEIISKPETVESNSENYDNSDTNLTDGSTFNSEISNEAVAAIGDNLSRIAGVEGVLVLKASGEVIYSKSVDDPDFESADTLFLSNQSKELGDTFNFKNLKSIICEANNNYRKIIINNKNIIYSLIVSSSVQALKTQAEAVKLLEG
jgi:hypothetical protein